MAQAVVACEMPYVRSSPRLPLPGRTRARLAAAQADYDAAEDACGPDDVNVNDLACHHRSAAGAHYEIVFELFLAHFPGMEPAMRLIWEHAMSAGEEANVKGCSCFDGVLA